MKNYCIGLIVLALSVSLIACGDSKVSAKSAAQKWCDLNGKVARATTEEDQSKAKKARKEYETELDNKYKNDQAFLDEVKKEVEKCEDASEGK
jgi:hypothetical protein